MVSPSLNSVHVLIRSADFGSCVSFVMVADKVTKETMLTRGNFFPAVNVKTAPVSLNFHKIRPKTCDQ
jgi:hypothetical protein